MDVSQDSFSIDNFKPTGEDCYSNVNLNRLDAFGYVTATYTWTDCGGEDWDTSDVWVDDDNNIVTGITFGPGEALLVNGASSDQALQSAGEVPTKDLAVQLKNGATLVGIGVPVSVPLTEIYPTGDEIYSNVNINVLDSYGYVLATYTWTDCGGEDWDTADVWVDDDNNIITDVTFNPGEGFLVNGSNENQYLNIPAPELN